MFSCFRASHSNVLLGKMCASTTGDGGNVTKHHEFSTYLGRLGEDMSGVSRHFLVPSDADHIEISFLFYEIDFWCSCDHMTVEVCDTQVDLGKFTPGDRGYVEGEVDGITWSSNSLTGSNMMGFNGFNDQKHEMKMTIPARCYATGDLYLAFNLTTHDLAKGGIDNLNITAFGLCGVNYDFPDIETAAPEQTNNPTPSPTLTLTESPTTSLDKSACTEERLVTFEDFDGFYDNTWQGGQVSDEYQQQFSHFLGRFGREDDRAAKTFDVPNDAKSLTCEFLFYEIDQWEKRDRFLFIVGGTRLDLQQFGLQDPVNNPGNIYSLSGKAGGISWQRTTETNSTDLGFSAAKDQKHKITVSIPSWYYAETGKLKVGFHLETSHATWSESAGVDDFKIIAHGTGCHSRSSDRVSSSENMEVCAHFWGDPHLVSYDGLKYDCQGEGEFVLTRSLDSDFQIQARFENAVASNKRVAVTRGYVIQTGDLFVPRIQLETRNMTQEGCGIDMFVDGIPHDIETNGTQSDFVQVTLAIGNEGVKRITVYYPASGLHFSSLLSESETYGCYLSSSVCLPDDYRTDETFVGLLGSPNGDRNDDWMSPTGSTVAIASDKRFRAAYDYCTSNWCLRNESESLFTYNGQSNFASHSNCDLPYNTDIEDAIANAPDELIDVCAGDITCIIDGVASGEVKDAEMDLENEAYLVGCKKLIYFDDFEDSIGRWGQEGVIDSRSDSLSTFLGPFGQGQTGTTKEFTVPADANRIHIEFMYYEIGSWNEDSSFSVRIGSTTLDFKEFDSSLTKLEGLDDGIFWSRHRTRTSEPIIYGSNFVLVHKVLLSIPNRYYHTTGLLNIAFMHDMIHSLEIESGGIDSFVIKAYFADCIDGKLERAAEPEVSIHSGAASTLWSNGELSCSGDSNIRLECFGDPTTNANTYPRTARIRFEESFNGYVCTQGDCDDCIGSITVDAVATLEDGATLFDFSSDDFVFAGFGIETGSGISSLQLTPPLNEAAGVGNIAETNSVSHTEWCLSPISHQNTRKLDETEASVNATVTEYKIEEEECASGFAYSEEHSIPFTEFGFEDSVGWTSRFKSSNEPYTLALRSKNGRLIAYVSVVFDGQKSVISYEAIASMHLTATYTFLGGENSFLPMDGAKESINPEIFPIVHTMEASSLSDAQHDVLEISGFSDGFVSVIAYATVCVDREDAHTPPISLTTKKEEHAEQGNAMAADHASSSSVTTSTAAAAAAGSVSVSGLRKSRSTKKLESLNHENEKWHSKLTSKLWS